MKQIFKILALLTISQLSAVQSVFSQGDTLRAFTFPVLNKYGKTLNDFLPKNWEITDTISGDLNKDGINDFVLVLGYRDSIKIKDGYKYPRVFLIVFKVKDHYELKFQHNTLLEYELTAESGYTGGWDGDPLESMEIAKGVLSIHFKWDITGVLTYLKYFVRYQSNDFYLIGATFASGYHADSSTSDFNFSTRRYTYDEADYESGFGGEDKEYHKKGKLPHNSLKKMSEIIGPRSWNVAGIAEI